LNKKSKWLNKVNKFLIEKINNFLEHYKIIKEDLMIWKEKRLKKLTVYSNRMPV
jgi:inorganic pyrophosphatase